MSDRFTDYSMRIIILFRKFVILLLSKFYSYDVFENKKQFWDSIYFWSHFVQWTFFHETDKSYPNMSAVANGYTVPALDLCTKSSHFSQSNLLELNLTWHPLSIQNRFEQIKTIISFENSRIEEDEPNKCRWRTLCNRGKKIVDRGRKRKRKFGILSCK